MALDDDPTGPQGSAAVPVLLHWDDVASVRAAVRRAAGAVHVITNSRSLDPDAARSRSYEAAAAVVTALGSTPPIIMRGDSTLRGHLLEEYLALREVVAHDSWPALLLVPALPTAGRVTVGGVHLLEGLDGVRRPLHETEYAADPVFGYPDADLCHWAEYRSAGLFSAGRGVRVTLADVRSARGAQLVADAIATAAGGPAVVVPDAETLQDVAVIAAGWRLARQQVPVLVRCGPAFITVAGGTAASRSVDFGPLDRTLVVCGSHVGLSTLQLAALQRRRPNSTIEVHVDALVDNQPGVCAREVERAAMQLGRLLDRSGFAVLATPRVRSGRHASLDSGRRVAEGLIAVVRSLPTPPDAAIVKGGITSATIARDGFGAATGMVIGPVEPGVALWELDTPTGPLNYVVVPGNVGDEGTLVRLADRVAPARTVAT